MPNVGEYIKVSLPGETPWALVTEPIREDAVRARIDNHLVSDLHDFEYGQVVRLVYQRCLASHH